MPTQMSGQMSGHQKGENPSKDSFSTGDGSESSTGHLQLVGRVQMSPWEPVGDTIGERLRSLRDCRSISKKALAEKLGYGEKTIGRWESGASYPSRLTQGQLSKALVALECCHSKEADRLAAAVLKPSRELAVPKKARGLGKAGDLLTAKSPNDILADERLCDSFCFGLVSGEFMELREFLSWCCDSLPRPRLREFLRLLAREFIQQLIFSQYCSLSADLDFHWDFHPDWANKPEVLKAEEIEVLSEARAHFELTYMRQERLSKMGQDFWHFKPLLWCLVEGASFEDFSKLHKLLKSLFEPVQSVRVKDCDPIARLKKLNEQLPCFSAEKWVQYRYEADKLREDWQVSWQDWMSKAGQLERRLSMSLGRICQRFWPFACPTPEEEQLESKMKAFIDCDALMARTARQLSFLAQKQLPA